MTKTPAERPASLPFVDLSAQAARLRPRIEERLRAVLDHGQFILGPEVGLLEQKLAEFVGAGEAVTTSSGHDALVIALMAEGIGKGHAVFVPAYTFVSTAEAVASLGAWPVFVDVDPATFTMDPDDLARRVEAVKKVGELTPRAVIPVDIYGMPCDYGRIAVVARAEEMFVLADAAQSFGARVGNRRAGRLATATATSFFPAKPLGAYGDGGALFTEDKARAAEWRRLRVHGLDSDGECLSVGTTGRLDTLQAAVLLAKLEAFPDELERRERAAQAYGALLGDAVTVPARPNGRRSAWALYTILSDKRDKIRAALAEEGIPSRVYYEKALHLHRAFAAFSEGRGSLPTTESIGRRNLSLPMHADLDASTIERIAGVVLRAVGG